MNLNEIQNMYSKHLSKEEDKIERRKKKILEDNPDIKKIENEINELDYKRVQVVLSGLDYDGEKLKEIKQKIKDLQKLKKEKIQKLNLPKDYLKLEYICNICKDKGYIKEKGKTIRCKCITQKLLNEKYNNSNLKDSEKENFDNFNLNFYSDEIKDKNKKSSRENIKEILEVSKNFVLDFNNKKRKYKNLFFTGKTGIGKTFLSNAIAKEIIKNGNTVFYQTSPMLFDELMINKFKDSDKYYEILNNIMNADLLIIDDFGAESLSESKMKEIFSIINTRLINEKSTIISSNLDLNEIAGAYDDRIVSRIIGNYTIKKFYGDDIRILKKKKIKYE